MLFLNRYHGVINVVDNPRYNHRAYYAERKVVNNKIVSVLQQTGDSFRQKVLSSDIYTYVVW